VSRQEIDALDAEIQALESSIDQTSGMTRINAINEQICAKKIEMQRLLSIETRAVPADIREQLDSLDQQIGALEREVSKVTDVWIQQGGDSQAKYLRLTKLKLEKQRLLAGRPSLSGSEVVQ
jgi:hypothetical protein